jgi:hypothetical protein
MAMSGSVQTSAYSNRTVAFNWSANNNGNRTATINWSIVGAGSNTGYINVGPVNSWANGSQILNYTGRTACYQGTVFGSGSFPVNYDDAGNASFVVSVSAAIYSSSENCYSGDVTQYLDNIGYRAPTVNSTSYANIVRTSVNLSASVNTYGASITGGGWDISTNGGTSWTYYDGGPTSASITGLTPNTQYWYRNYVVTSGGSANSGWSTFTTSGNVPTISSTSTSGISTNGATINYSASYDINASYSSREIQYGTTTSYGNSTTNNALSSLSANTTYYYRIRVTDNFNRTSDWSTGNFTTYPNTVAVVNPQITNIIATGCTLTMQSSDSTNTEYSSYTIYNSDKTIKIQGSYDNTPPVYTKAITGLEPNTIYWAVFSLKTVRSGAWSTAQWVQFTTLSADYVKPIMPIGWVYNAITEKGLSTTKSNINFWNNIDVHVTPLLSGWCKFELNNTGTSTDYADGWVNLSAINLKSSTYYTIIVDTNNVNKSGTITNNFCIATSRSDEAFSSSAMISNSSLNNGRYIFYLQTKADLTSTIGLRMFLAVDVGGNISLNARIMILEGDFRTTPPIEYRSCEGYKKMYFISGKNLFHNDNTVTKDVYIATDGTIVQSTGICYSDYIKLEPDTDYIASGKSNWHVIALYDANKNFIQRVTNTTTFIYHTTTDTVYGILMCSTSDLETCQLELGNIATTYEAGIFEIMKDKIHFIS